MKPFYIKKLPEHTDEMVAEVFDKAVSRGATLCEGVKRVHEEAVHRYYPINWKYFGVNDIGDSRFEDAPARFGDTATEITIDQVDEWLGIEASVDDQEWKNGDDCIYKGEKWQFVSILSEDFHGTAVIFNTSSEGLKQVPLDSLQKPNPQQSERLEAAYDLYKTHHSARGMKFTDYISFVRNEIKNNRLESWLAIVDKTGYRKETDNE